MTNSFYHRLDNIPWFQPNLNTPSQNNQLPANAVVCILAQKEHYPMLSPENKIKINIL